jgi:hypothetical protein
VPLDTLFQAANIAALTGWAALALSPLMPRLAELLAGYVIPAALALIYSGLVLAHWSRAPGGFGDLPAVMALFTAPPVALAGWTHYLAFDLAMGAWAVRACRARGVPHLLVLPALALTFLFGPAGFLLTLALLALFPRHHEDPA